MLNLESPIKVLRKKIGKSQRELANALGVHHSLIANLENNLVHIDNEDDEENSKVRKIFEQLADWSGENVEDLIQKQKESTLKSTEKMKATINKQLARQLSEVAEKFGGSSSLEGDEVMFFIDFLREKCEEECISPIKAIREEGGITQRHLAQAAEVSQAYIARLERGELPLHGPNTGIKLIEFIIKGLGINLDEDETAYEELFNALITCQEKFIECNKELAKNNVMAAFEKLKKEQNGKE